KLVGIDQEWGDKISALFHQNNLVTSQAKNMAEQFKRDMEVLREISAVTGQSVKDTLTNISASSNQLRFAADKSIEAGSTFNKQPADITEKLIAATNLLRASGKVMSETSDAARTRLMEAVTSVAGHDEALRAFIADTGEKSNRIAAVFEGISANAARAA